MDKQAAIQTMNELGSEKIPFVFVIDFNMKNIEVIENNDLEKHGIKFNIGKNQTESTLNSFDFSKKPISFNEYKKSFDIVLSEIRKGNSYLTNLTAETKLEASINLRTIFKESNAPYKLLFKDKFVCFSPETFVKISRHKIFSYPMKGTIDATLPNAKKLILNNQKEAAEHATITDLIRNDLSRISTNVKVEKYRYIDQVKTHEGELLQVSSVISGELEKDYEKKLGSLLFELLPAGSISGAPKQKTIEIIKKAETYDRGYYTGVFGVFDGTNIDSAVMIRFIENINGQLVFKSGGGITINSNAKDEYEELIKKVYLPFKI